MPKKVITVTYPNGTKKLIVGKESNNIPIKESNNVPIKENNTPVKVRTIEKEDKKPKPIMGRAGLTSSKRAYKYGGKINVRKR